jgi:hypothetical protein
MGLAAKNDGMSDEPKRPSLIHFWNRLGNALELFAVSIVLWTMGTEAANGHPRLNPTLAWLRFVSPFVAIAAIVWTLAIVKRRIRPNKRRPR